MMTTVDEHTVDEHTVDEHTTNEHVASDRTPLVSTSCEGDRSRKARRFPSDKIELELISGLGASEIAHRLLSSHRLAEVGQRGVAFYLHEFEESGGYFLLGYASTLHFAAKRMDLKKTVAYELLRAGKVLSECAILDREFCSGHLSWSKVAMLCRVVTRHTQAAWIELAKPLTVRELEIEVRSSQRDKLPRKERKGLPVVRVKISEEVDVLTKEMWDTARQKFEEETGDSASHGSLVRFLANGYLNGEFGETGESGEKKNDGDNRRKRRSIHQVVVQRCPDCKKTDVFTDEGRLPVDPDLVKTVLPDAEQVHLREIPIDETKEIDRPTPSWMQKMVLSRDGHRCRSCHGKWELMAHHIEWRSHGGRTHPRNLLGLCGRCHGMAHERLLFVEGDPESEIEFRDSIGQRLDGSDAAGDSVGTARIRRIESQESSKIDCKRDENKDGQAESLNTGDEWDSNICDMRDGNTDIRNDSERDLFSGCPERSLEEKVPSTEPRASIPPELEDIPDVVSLEWWHKNKHFFTPNNKGIGRYILQSR